MLLKRRNFHTISAVKKFRPCCGYVHCNATCTISVAMLAYSVGVFCLVQPMGKKEVRTTIYPSRCEKNQYCRSLVSKGSDPKTVELECDVLFIKKRTIAMREKNEYPGLPRITGVEMR